MRLEGSLSLLQGRGSEGRGEEAAWGWGEGAGGRPSLGCRLWPGHQAMGTHRGAQQGPLWSPWGPGRGQGRSVCHPGRMPAALPAEVTVEAEGAASQTPPKG